MITSPLGVTTVRLITSCFIAPYFTVVVPEAPVAAMPPNVASAPGSTGKNNPCVARISFSCFLRTPGCNVQSRSSWLMRSTLSICETSRETPPYIGVLLPSNEVPAPNATTGVQFLLQILRVAATSSVQVAYTTASGSEGRWKLSSLE